MTRLVLGAAAAALLAGAAAAQTPAAMPEHGDHAVNAPVSTTTAASATAAGADVSTTTTTDADGSTVTVSMVTNGPVPDTAENRAKYGQPLSRAGKMTRAAGN